MKKSLDSEAWLLGMNNFFTLHDYSVNMKARIATFSLRVKAYIWWEDINNVKYIYEEELTWSEFERLFRKRYLSEIYCDDREK